MIQNALIGVSTILLMIRSDKRFRCVAFSFLEILVVLTVISVLAAFMMPVIQKSRDRGRQVQCLANMRQIGLAFRTYQNDHKGKYPQVALSATQNWESYLCDPTIGGVYIGANLIGTDGAGEKRFKTSFMCPTMVKRSDFAVYSYYWGYSINNARVDISYNAGGAPWNNINYQNADLDDIYKEPATMAVLTDGNQRNFGSGDWNAFTDSGGWWDWTIIPIHGDGINVLFLDGHIEFMNVKSAADQTKVNYALYHGIPATGNTW